MTKLWMWTDVWTAGYPDSATMILQGNPEYPPRGYHGYITRTIPEGDWLGFQHSDLFELSFPVVLGMSGAPLFLRETRALPSFELIGVCIGSRSSEVEEYQHEEVEENGSVSRERRLRVEQYGLAQDIRPLLKWKPELLNGQRLGDAIRSSFGPGRG
jgi:hypothetical protein